LDSDRDWDFNKFEVSLEGEMKILCVICEGEVKEIDLESELFTNRIAICKHCAFEAAVGRPIDIGNWELAEVFEDGGGI